MNALHMLDLDRRARPMRPRGLRDEIQDGLIAALSALDEIESRLTATMGDTDVRVYEGSDDLAAIRKAVRCAVFVLEQAEVAAGRVDG